MKQTIVAITLSALSLGSCVQSLSAQVVFSPPVRPSDTLTVRSRQTPALITYFDSTARPDKRASTKERAIVSNIDSLLIGWADSTLLASDGDGQADLISHLPFIPAIPPVRLTSWQQYRVSSRFGWRIHPIGGDSRLHNGVDLPQPVGTPVYATADGVVKWVRYSANGLGLAVCIEHPTGYQSIYGHLSACTVRWGEGVQRGTVIGRVGNTGRSTGAHLHYTILYKGKPVNPDRYFFLWMRLTQNSNN